MPAALAADTRRVFNSPVGPLLARADDAGLRSLEFLNEARDVPHEPSALLDELESELAEYFRTGVARFSIPLAPAGTPFQQQVWSALREIPCGETRSYTDIARTIGRPDAVRAVAGANGDNPIAILIPCHRVIGADGTLTGYGGGLWRKELLLNLEGARLFPRPHPKSEIPNPKSAPR